MRPSKLKPELLRAAPVVSVAVPDTSPTSGYPRLSMTCVIPGGSPSSPLMSGFCLSRLFAGAGVLAAAPNELTPSRIQ
jgi:hypothetical protein